jgi:hypothetical protein
VLATRFEALDPLLDGGVPRGRLTEILGRPTSGATSLALQVIASAQRDGDAAVYLDLAAAFDPGYAVHQGVETAELVVARPSFDLALEMLFDLVVSGIPGTVVFNMLPSLLPSQRQMLATVLMRLQGHLIRSRCVLLVLAPPERVRAGISQVAAMRLQVERETWVYQRQTMQGYCARVTILKYKPGSEGQTAHIQIPVKVDAGGNA